MALRLLLAGAPQLAPELHRAISGRAEVSQSGEVDRPRHQDDRRPGVRLHPRGFAHHRLSRSHRGQEHVSRLHNQGKTNNNKVLKNVISIK